jgi:hypothetical protein
MGGKGGTAHLGGVYGSGTPGAPEPMAGEESGDEGECTEKYELGPAESMVKHRLTGMGTDRGSVDASTIAHLANAAPKPCG